MASEINTAAFPFDDTKKALMFALNAHDAKVPSPVMNRAMQETPAKAPSKAQARRIAKAWADAGVDLIERVARSNTPQRRPGWWSSLKEPERAGLVLLELGKMDRKHQLLLTGLLMKSHAPCACRRPCCSGMAVDMRWQACVTETCSMLAATADFVGPIGKKGLSTQPTLRRLAVEQYFTGHSLTLSDLRRIADVSMVTAAKHRTLIHDWMRQTEEEAWPEINVLLEAAGILGANHTSGVHDENKSSTPQSSTKKAETGLQIRLARRRSARSGG